MTDNFSVPADWYPDPNGGPMLRWWDGQSWTEHLQSTADPKSLAATPNPATEDPRTLVKNWSSILWLRKSFLGPCPVGALSIVADRISFVTKKRTLFDFPVADATYSVGAAIAASPLIIQSPFGKFVLLGYYAHGRQPNADLRARVKQVLELDDAIAMYKFSAEKLGIPFLKNTALRTFARWGGETDEYTLGPIQTAAFCVVLANNGISVNTSNLR